MLLLEGNDNDNDNNYNNYGNDSNMSINTTTAAIDINTPIDDDLIAIGGLSIQRIDEAIR